MLNDNMKMLSEFCADMKDRLDNPLPKEYGFKIDKLLTYAIGLMGFSKFKIGEVVKIAVDIEITQTNNFGWFGYKDILVKDANAIIQDIDYHLDGFVYDVTVNGKGTFQFKEDWLKK